MKNTKERIGYVEWMIKIKSHYQYHTHIARGIDCLVNNDEPTIPPGVNKTPAMPL